MRKLWNNGLSRGANYYVRMKTAENSRRKRAGRRLAEEHETGNSYWYPSRPPLPPDHPVYQAWSQGEV